MTLRHLFLTALGLLSLACVSLAQGSGHTRPAIALDSCSPRTTAAARACLVDLTLMRGRVVDVTFSDGAVRTLALDDVAGESFAAREIHGRSVAPELRSFPLASVQNVSWPKLDAVVSPNAQRIKESAKHLGGLPNTAVQASLLSGEKLTGTIAEAGDLSFVLRESSGWETAVRYSDVSTLAKVKKPQSKALQVAEDVGIGALAVLLLPFYLIYAILVPQC
ncbi:MAG TPA: hypothetical protein VMT51_11385 [Dongiaceae bacterium]|nr:hypothetical protein [Dongiaceae bacterium]